MTVIRSARRIRAMRPFVRNAEAMQAQVDELREVAADRCSAVAARQSRERHVGRGKLLPRDRVAALLDRGTPFLEIGSSPPTACTTTMSRRRHDHRHRPCQRRGVHDRRQRCHGQGRHLLPDDGEEAPARAGDRRAERSALHLPGRLRRRIPAAPGRGLSRPRSFRPHLLQPGQHVGAGAFRRSRW